jgi:hypothetical protein
MANESSAFPGKYYIIIIPAVFVLGFIVRYITDRENKPKFDELHAYFVWVDSNEVCGRLSFVSTKASRLKMFGLEGQPDKKYFARIFLTGNEADKDFKDFAQRGDSIIKHKFSDTLILIKGGKAYQCRWLR